MNVQEFVSDNGANAYQQLTKVHSATDTYGTMTTARQINRQLRLYISLLIHLVLCLTLLTFKLKMSWCHFTFHHSNSGLSLIHSHDGFIWLIREAEPYPLELSFSSLLWHKTTAEIPALVWWEWRLARIQECELCRPLSPTLCLSGWKVYVYSFLILPESLDKGDSHAVRSIWVSLCDGLFLMDAFKTPYLHVACPLPFR